MGTTVGFLQGGFSCRRLYWYVRRQSLWEWGVGGGVIDASRVEDMTEQQANRKKKGAEPET